MPFTVITMTKAPNYLRGDLSKWMQEISTGVYVGNFNRRVREALWDRVVESIGDGEATLTYSCRNEIGYNFKTHNSQRQAVDFDGIPLVIFANETDQVKEELKKSGYSKASKFHKAKKFSRAKKEDRTVKKSYLVIDIETDGLDANKDNIIEIGAIKIQADKTEEFSKLINIEGPIPSNITDLTGISKELLESEGKGLSEILIEFIDFIDDFDLVGYNINFDISFINKSLINLGIKPIKNKTYDLMKYVKKEKKFLPNYKLSRVLKEYGIEAELPHRALEDARLIYQLSLKVKKFQDKIK